MVTRASEPRGIPAVGRIAKLWMGQSHGFIRLPDNREIYFHRADVREGTSFSDLSVGDAVVFELFVDRISGDRALQVRHHKPSRLTKPNETA